MTKMTFRSVSHDILELLGGMIDSSKIYITKREGNGFSFLYGLDDHNKIQYSTVDDLFENEYASSLINWTDSRVICEERCVEGFRNNRQIICKPLYFAEEELFGTLTVLIPIDSTLSSVQMHSLKTVTRFLNYALELQSVAIRDSLTGLYNRYFLEGYLSKLEKSVEDGYSIIYFDLDDFKYINDSLGHRTGDKLLQDISKDLKAAFPDYFVCRMGGDEFLLFLPAVKDHDVLQMLTKRVQKIFKKPYMIDGFEVYIKASIGIAIYPNDGESLEDIIRNADAAMYVAKRKGKNQAVFYEFSMNEDAMKRFELESYLNKALDYDEFELYYQPQIEVESGRVVGVEALIRWNHPKLGIVSPNVFLDIAEESNLIMQIGEWVLKTACQMGKMWIDAGYEPIKIGVNLSAKQFLQHDLADLISNTLKETGLPPSLLNLEITETVSVNDAKLVISILEQLRAIGIEISVDDFGTGYSSLAYLKDFPVNTLKIDQMFIRELEKDSQHQAIVNATIYLAHALNLRVVGEAVETKEQLLFLKEKGCDEIQGYYLSKPLPATKMTTYLKDYAEGKVPFDLFLKA
ncbi:putative bifunctional diguanylate cyclase/phosphodiesterase [Halalkalibacter nanhaiisediminis]|uniref:Polar amino acid transport system substrate-binding protein n=1 Tax=Halalkalibacter nanhaiisediminis TaxID=688079 RepID=A0A562QCL8_9BACI|nr:EAL domain-containing protein [Halalkalibacter nanhaiisediminis]TWI54474.1 polar amino acid transport system substrate-binding protein [Halalkalibacter nanhaiisediminis]